MKFYIVFGILAVLALHAFADESKDNNNVPAIVAAASDRTSAVTKPSTTTDGNKYQWSMVPTSYTTALATGGVVVVGVVVLLAIAAVVSPLFGYKLCQIFSTCEGPAAIGYSADNYAGYGSSSTQYPTYKKRSIEYVGPILQALNSAYEKYGQGVNPILMGMDAAKKFNAQQ